MKADAAVVFLRNLFAGSFTGRQVYFGVAYFFTKVKEIPPFNNLSTKVTLEPVDNGVKITFLADPKIDLKNVQGYLLGFSRAEPPAVEKALFAYVINSDWRELGESDRMELPFFAEGVKQEHLSAVNAQLEKMRWPYRVEKSSHAIRHDGAFGGVTFGFRVYAIRLLEETETANNVGAKAPARISWF